MRVLGVLLCLLWGTSGAEDDVVMRTMRDELARSMSTLQLEDLERPYFMAYRVRENSGVRASAEFGALVSSSEGKSRGLVVEVRVGDYEFDNTSGGRGGRSRSESLPLDDNYQELRRKIWLETDEVYKGALEDLSEKRASLQNQRRVEEIPDFSREEAVNLQEDLPFAVLDRTQAEGLVRALSERFRKFPVIHTASVLLSVDNIVIRYVNSEGTSFRRVLPVVRFEARAGTQAQDGMPLQDFESAYGQSMADLPGLKILENRIDSLGARLTALNLASIAEAYNGPVLFEGQAAAELFGQVFAGNLLGTRAAAGGGRRRGRGGGPGGGRSAFLDRIGSRVMPEFLSVVDNPLAEKYKKVGLVGGAKVDEDGVPKRKTVLVEKGYLKTLLTTRTPVSGISKSTGSRRGNIPAPSNLFVVAQKGQDAKKLRKTLLKMAKERGKDYGIVVRRIGNPVFRALRNVGRRGGRRSSVDSVILAYKVYPDGREVLVRNAVLSGLDASAFKDIVAASKKPTVYHGPVRGQGTTATVSFVVPDLLFEDVSLQSPTGEVPTPPVANHPFFDR